MSLDSHEFVVDEPLDGLRLDVFLAGQLDDASRSFVQKIAKSGGVTVNGKAVKRVSHAVRVDDVVMVELPPPPSTTLVGEDIPLDVLHEDADVLVINKPSGLVVHPAPGHRTGTLVQAVIHHCADLEPTGDDPDRPGIVHRLDRFTSGVMIVAKTRRAFQSLAGQAREHTFDRRYLALVRGEFPEDRGRIVATVGRSLAKRGRMSVTGIRGREAATRFEVLERFGCASLMGLRLETGRTHQVRVHMRFAGHPVLGDPLYGITDFAKWAEPLHGPLKALEGQALHAEVLGFTHPATEERLSFTAPPPPDFQRASDALRRLA